MVDAAVTKGIEKSPFESRESENAKGGKMGEGWQKKSRRPEESDGKNELRERKREGEEKTRKKTLIRGYTCRVREKVKSRWRRK